MLQLLKDPKKIRSELEKAYQLSNNRSKRPVWIDIPLDIQAAPIEPSKLLGFKKLSHKKI